MTQTRSIAVVRMGKNFLKLPGYSGLIVSYMNLYQCNGFVTESQALSQNDDERFAIQTWGKKARASDSRPISPTSLSNCEYHSLKADDTTDRLFYLTEEYPPQQMLFYTIEEFRKYTSVPLANLPMSLIRRGSVVYTRFDNTSALGESPAGYYLCHIAAKVDERGEEYVLTSDEEVCFRLHVSTSVGCIPASS